MLADHSNHEEALVRLPTRLHDAHSEKPKYDFSNRAGQLSWQGDAVYVHLCNSSKFSDQILGKDLNKYSESSSSNLLIPTGPYAHQTSGSTT